MGDQVHLVVDSEQKNRWEEHIEEQSQYDTISQLIRLSVENQIHNDNTNQGNSESDEIVEMRNQIIQEIQEVDRSLRAIDSVIVTEDELDTKLRAIRNQITSELEQETLTTEENLEQRLEELFEYYILQ